MTRHLPLIALGSLLAVGLFAPLAAGLSAPGFWFEVLLGGLMAGVLYSLVALGFVLIFKASGVFNFAQTGVAGPPIVVNLRDATTFHDRC